MAAEFGIALGANLVTEVVKSISRTIKQEILYVFKYQSYVEDLNEQVQQLTHKREREQLRVDHAVRQGDEIHTDVDEWLTQVNEFILKFADPIGSGDEGARAKTHCFNLKTRYKVGKKALKAAKTCSNLLKKELEEVSHRPGPQRTASMYVRDYEAFDSRESILQDIMDALNDANVKRIGVHGLGGVGKTTLVKKVAWQAKDYKLFDEVVIAEVTQKPDNRRIQDKIASDLGLTFEQCDNEFDRALRLRNRLKRGKRVLVILDNIWAKPDFEAIGIPFGDYGKESGFKEDCKEKNDDNQRLYKILVTSRNLGVLRNDMNIQKNFLVEILSPQEAQNLFWKIVDNDSAKSSTDFGTIAEEILGKCADLPLAIVTIANALKNKSIHAWEDALEKLRAASPRSIPEMNEEVVSVIELSFNLLQSEETKKLFLLCSLIDDGHGASHDDILRYGMGWGLFQNVRTLLAGRNRVHTLIDNLKDWCLLLEGDTTDWVKMHEFVCAVAISIASTNNLMFNIQDAPDLNKVLEEKISKNSTAISLPCRDISELPERLGCSKLELFFLFMNYPCLQIPDRFFEGMKELKVIDFTGLNLRLLPSSFVYLTNLKTLCLDECLLGDISTIGELKNLEILSFSRSRFEKLPEEIGKLTGLKLLDLSKCSELKVITPNVISRLSQLEELYLDDSSVQWENELDNQDGINANLAELNQLSRLTTLYMCFPDAKIVPQNLSFPELKRYKILIGNEWNWSPTNEASKTLKVKLNNSSYLRYNPIKVLLKITEDLSVDELNGIQNVLYELDGEGFPHLKYLHAQNGHELLYIANSAGRLSCNVFPMLEALSLNNLIKLKKICHGSLKQTSFSKFKSVKVNKCDGLKHLFSISMAKSLSQLEEIEVTDCENLKAIFAEEDDEDRVHNQGESNSKIEFARLRSLTLKGLPQFTSFSLHVKTHHTAEDHDDLKTLFGKRVVLPALSELRLSSIAIEMICHNKLLATSCFQNLTILDINRCDNLRYLLPSSLVKSLVRLQQIKIRNCMSMECVILMEDEGMCEMMKFPRLKSLILEDLPRLKMFCKDTENLIEFPSLSELEIDNCVSMETFISNSISAIAEVLEGNFPADIQPLFDEKVTLPNLEILTVLSMDNLGKIWDDDQHNLDSFGKLREMRLAHCHKLLNIFPSIMHGRLLRLEVLKVWHCDSLEEIFRLQALCGRETNVITASRLRELVLYDLPNLKHVWNMHNQVILGFQNLLSVDVYNCKNLESIFPASIAIDLLELQQLFIESCMMDEIVTRLLCHNKLLATSCFQNLTILDINRCDNLRYLLPSSLVKSIVRLQQIKIRNCMSMECVILMEEEGMSEMMKFPILKSLILDDLPRLKMFCKDTGNLIEFPSLSELEIDNVSMETFISNSISAISEVLEENFPADIQPLFDEKVRLPNLEILLVLNVDNLRKIWDDDQHNLDSFGKLREMRLAHCNKLLNIFPCIMHRRLLRLEVLKVWHCDSLEEIFKLQALCGRETNVITASRLRKLVLYDLPNLKHVWNMHNRVILGFQNLLSVDVYNCNNLESIFPASIARDLLELQQLVIESCMMDEIVHKEEEVEAVPWFIFPRLASLELIDLPRLRCFYSVQHSLFLLDKVAFPNLEYLKLSKLPELLHLWTENSQTGEVFQNLATLKVSECNKLTNIAPPSASFHNLTTLEVSKCDEFISLMTSSTARSLTQLTRMDITDCKSIVQIIRVTDLENEVKDEIVFKELEYLGLERLPRLENFCLSNRCLEFPSLEKLTVRECTKMESFSQGNLSTPKLQRLQRTEADDDEGYWKGDLNTSIQQMFKEMNAQSCTED